ncbi:MAG: septal ring lytic transglycosylase RlpA family protein [Ignavibacteriales bacterium]|nr:septal ring lytic transglycosylase RlpA family protein [Ignavibacteriales bacterium]
MKSHFYNIILLFGFLFISCSSSTRFSNEKSEWQSKHQLHKRSDFITPSKTTTGTASYYGKKFNGKKTASGEMYNMFDLSASHKTYPLGTKVRITNLKNYKSIVLIINDRMPARNNRMIDLSYGAAKELDMLKSGLAEVKIEVLEWGKKK